MTGTGAPPLDTDVETFRRFALATVDLLCDMLEREARDPVLPAVTGRDLRAQWSEPLPRRGRPFEEVLARLSDHFLPFVRRNGHPRFFGYVCASAAPVGALADALASLANQNVTAWRSAPAATEMERQVVRWLDEMAGFGSGHGLLVSGGSAANATALAAALDAGGRRRAGAVYLSREGHVSLRKALRILGVAGEDLREVAVDGGRRMVPQDLAAQMARDAERGVRPLCVCASAGTVNTGAIDPVAEIAAVAGRHGAWLHVDGAYGAPAALLEEHADLRAGLARADSLSLDPHKWLFAPMDAGCVLFRDDGAAQRAFRLESEYTTIFHEDPLEAFAFFDRGLELSRRARALKVWAILETHGADAIADAVARNIALRRRLDERVEAERRLEALGSGLSIACFRYVPAGGATGAHLDDLNRRILEALVAGGRFFLSPTSIDGRFALRICIVNFRTAERDVDELADEILRLGARLRS